MNKEELQKLKEETDTAVLAHYYVDGQVQEMADHVGDSFFLATKATELDNKNIIMAGVQFMGETIKILNPEKNVYLPNQEADCPMAHMVTIEEIENMRNTHDDLAVVCYVNSTSEIKAHSDYCCTSANVQKVIGAIEEENIFFIPDKNLGGNIQELFPDKKFYFNDGHCYVHDQITRDTVKGLKNLHPNAKVLAHPECRPEIMDLVDFKGSTSGILKAVGEMDGDEFIVITEEGILWELQKRYPEKTFIFPDMICDGMKVIKPEQIIDILKNGGETVEIDEDLRKQALVPLERMLDASK